jgi:phenylacetate-CoA ligase
LFKEFLTIDDLKKLSWSKIEKLQNRRFVSIVHNLLPHSVFYKEFFKKHMLHPQDIKSVEDWKRYKLPLIKKKTYIERTRDFIIFPKGSHKEIFDIYFKFVASISKQEGARLLSTGLSAKLSKRQKEKLSKEVRSFFKPKMPAFAGGSESGHPIPVLITANQKLKIMVNTADISAYLIITRHFNNPDDSVTAMNLFPYAPHIAWQIINMAAELRADLNLSTAAGGFLSTDKLIRIAKSSKPNVFSGMVDYLINIFLPKAIEEGVKLDKKVVFLNGATKMLQIQREQIKKLFKELGVSEVIVLDGYGASELKEATLAECEEGSGFHHVSPLSNIIRTVKIGKVDPDSDYIYDWDFTSNEEGGYAAIWNIDGAGTLLQGYLLGDHYDKVTTDRCPHCGLNVKRIYNINRIADLATEMKIMGIDEEKIDGTTINLTALRERLLNLHDIREAQLVVHHGNPKDELIVNYIPKSKNYAKVRKEIKAAFDKYSDVHPAEINKIKLSDIYNEKNLKYNGIMRKNNEIH